MKNIIIILIFVFLAPIAHAEFKVEIRTSKIHGFYDFIETISGKPHHSDIILKFFQESVYNDAKTKQWISEIQHAQESMPGFSFNGFPSSRKSGADVELLFDIQSIFSKDLNDFSTRTLGMMPESDHAHFFAAAKNILPIYEKLIWNPSFAALTQYKKKLIQVSKKAKIDELFKKAVQFYGSDWPNDQPFVISLYPTPGKKGATSSSSLGATESVGVMMSDHDFEGTFGVMFHELCHSLYSAQPIDFQFKLEKMFLNLDSNYSAGTYRLLNEGLATALGNGYAFKSATGKIESHSWYNNQYINAFSKAIYPLVEEYLQKNKTIDEEFVKKSISVLETTQSKILNEYDFFIQWLLMAHDAKTVNTKTLREMTSKEFRMSSRDMNSPINTDETLKMVTSSRDALFVVFSYDENKQLEALSEKIPFVKEHLKELKSKKEDYVYSALDSKGRAFIFIQVSNDEGFSKAIKAMKTAKRINPEVPFMILK